MATKGLVGRVLEGVGGVAVEHAKSTIDENRQIRMEKLRQTGRRAERTEEREYQKGVTKEGQEFRTSERVAGEGAQMERTKVGIEGRKLASRVKLKSSTKLDDGTILYSYTDGSAEILDPDSGVREKFSDIGKAKAKTRTKGDARAEAEDMFDKLNDGPLWFDKLDLSRFQDSEDLAKAKMVDMIMAGASDSEIMEFMITDKEAGNVEMAAKGVTPPADPDPLLPSGMPDATKNPDRIIKDKTTGKRFKSDGAQWQEV